MTQSVLELIFIELLEMLKAREAPRPPAPPLGAARKARHATYEPRRAFGYTGVRFFMMKPVAIILAGGLVV